MRGANLSLITISVFLIRFSLLACACCLPACGQFVDNFDGPNVALDPQGRRGWMILAGDGTATMDLRQGDPGYASAFVDGTTDKRGIWWALMERQVSQSLDIALLKKPG